MSFGAPRLLWLAGLAPLAALAAAALWHSRLAADAAWAARGLWNRLLPTYRPGRLRLAVACLALAVLGTALALARPRWGGADQKVERRGVDMVFLLDSSLSMAAPDVAPSRMFVAKALVRRMTQAMPGNRMGLVQTEGESLVLAPLTLDGAVLDLLLDTVEAGSLPQPGTELAAGIDSALRLFGHESEKHRALVILSDGEDHGGGLASALAKLKESGVVVYALGIGTPEGSKLPVPGGVKRDAHGNVVISRLHEEVLEALTRGTGGHYMRAGSVATDPAPVLARLDRLEKRTLESETLATLEERFQVALGLAVAALLLSLAAGPFAPAPEEARRPQLAPARMTTARDWPAAGTAARTATPAPAARASAREGRR